MINNSKVLALKYRPKTFDDLIGQDLIAETIVNSIKLKKIPNAYLFTGIRGVGKTTIARIVAKSLNCLKGIEKICKDKMSIPVFHDDQHGTAIVVGAALVNSLKLVDKKISEIIEKRG